MGERRRRGLRKGGQRGEDREVEKMEMEDDVKEEKKKET